MLGRPGFTYDGYTEAELREIIDFYERHHFQPESKPEEEPIDPHGVRMVQHYGRGTMHEPYTQWKRRLP